MNNFDHSTKLKLSNAPISNFNFAHLKDVVVVQKLLQSSMNLLIHFVIKSLKVSND